MSFTNVASTHRRYIYSSLIGSERCVSKLLVAVQRFPWIHLRVCVIEWVLAVLHAASLRVMWALNTQTRLRNTIVAPLANRKVSELILGARPG